MAKTLNFIIGIHNHQPVGNFDFVLEKAYRTAYLPFVEILEKHPKIRTSIHWSGIILKWLIKEHPEYISKVREMVDREQLEILTGGLYEPIMPMLYDRDKLEQIKALTVFIKKNLNYASTGMWLPERVWEPQLAKPIADAGVEYTLVDDTHFKSAGLTENELYGYYTTEEQGAMLRIFPISMKLRYFIPFRQPEETIKYLWEVATEGGDRVLVFGDDGEKFGVWPNTYEWVYEKRWLERFFEALEENRSWINLTTFSDFIRKHNAIGTAYLPTASYLELTEWALPAEASIKFEEVLEEARKRGEYEKYEGFLKGGFWRNFLAKYPESNNMYKKMLYVSNRVHLLEMKKSEESLIKKIKDELWQGQCNCAYWHGVFGGLYLPHLRSAIYQHLINAEFEADKKLHKTKEWLDMETMDFDKDGRDEILVNTETMNLYIHSIGGSLFEVDYKPKFYNLLNTLSRRKEAYHRKILETKGGKNISDVGGNATPSIHDLEKAVDPELESYLTYDWYRRLSFIDHFLDERTNLENFSKCRYGEYGDFVNQPYTFETKKSEDKIAIKLERNGGMWRDGTRFPIDIKKILSVNKGESKICADYEITNRSDKTLDIWFGVEFNFAILSGTSENAYYEVRGRKDGLADVGAVHNCDGIRIVDKYVGIDAKLKIDANLNLDSPANIWYFPIYTISQSESGYEKNYQSSVVFPNWRFRLRPNDMWKTRIGNEIVEYKT
jgi:alpha-amylase